MRPITDVLRDVRGGQFVDAATDVLATVVKAVLEHRKAGEVTITLKLKPDPVENGVEIDAQVKSKTPLPSVGKAIFFADEEGGLLRTDPRQREMFTGAKVASETYPIPKDVQEVGAVVNAEFAARK